MMNIETWFLLSSFVVLLWGVSGVFAKYSTGRLGVARVALLITAVEGPLYIAAFILLREPHAFTLYEVVLATGSCMLGIFGYLCYFESILQGKVAIAGTISAGYPVLTVLGAVLFLSESLTALQGFGIVAIMAGMLFISYEPNPNATGAMSRRSLIFAGLAFFAWGAWSFSSKVAIDMIGPGNIFGFYVISSFAAPLMYAWFRTMSRGEDVKSDPSKTAWSFGVIALAVNVIGAFAYSYALDSGSASLVVPISSAYPIVTVVLALAILRERVNVGQAIALVGVVTGLVMIGITV